MDRESRWDLQLRIKTCGRDETHADQYHHPYEPTPYTVLERLEGSGLIGPENVVLDYGCGKGRVGIFLADRVKAKVIGIEYDPHIYQNALENCAAAKVKAEFALAKAEEFPVPVEADRCYFFNPFSVEILKKVMARILESYYDEPREILLFFYYPSDEFVAYLMHVDALDFYDEIECDDLFLGKDNRERILIFQLPGL